MFSMHWMMMMMMMMMNSNVIRRLLVDTLVEGCFLGHPVNAEANDLKSVHRRYVSACISLPVPDLAWD